MTTPADVEIYRRADGSAWVGERWVGRTPAEAVARAPVPASDDPRWQKGKPEVLDTPVLTLSPFSPSGRLGAKVEQKARHPQFRYPNHPPFDGAVAWMPLEALDWSPVADLAAKAEVPANVLSRPRVR